MKQLSLLLTPLYLPLNFYAQDTLSKVVSKLNSDVELLKRVKITGYIQTQFQWADSSGQVSYNGGNFGKDVDKRFQIRRARIKTEYTTSLSQFVFQVDMTEKGLSIKDCYLRVTEPFLKTVSLTAGMMNRPFGFEIPFSSSQRESAERGRMSQILFPNERDLGAQVTIQAPKGTKWNMLKLEAGWFNGTGAPSAGGNGSDFDYQKDFIGRFSLNTGTSSGKIKAGLGLSYYDGGYRKGSKNVYSFGADSLGVPGYVLDLDTVPGDAGKAVKRQYLGADFQLSAQWPGGTTTIRGEYIMGQQPGTYSTSTSPTAQPTADVYIRNFNGAYFYFVHRILKSGHYLVFKYDWYDPNSEAVGDEIGQSVTSGTQVTVKSNRQDIRYTTLGAGWVFDWGSNFRIMAYYDRVANEFSKNLSGYTTDISDDVVTLRLQYKF